MRSGEMTSGRKVRREEGIKKSVYRIKGMIGEKMDIVY